MLKKEKKFKYEKETLISKWEYVVELYQKARKEPSVKNWGKLFFVILRFSSPLIIRLILKIIFEFFKDFQ